MNISGILIASLLNLAGAPSVESSRAAVVRAATEVLAKQGFDVASDDSKLALSVKIDRVKRGFVARVQVVERGNKEVVVSARKKFMRANEASSVGKAVGRVLAAGLKAEELDVEPAVVEKPKVRVVRPVDEDESSLPPEEDLIDEEPVKSKPVKSRPVDSNARAHRPAEVSSRIEDPESIAEAPQKRWLLIGVGLGSQISSAYAVVVGGETTGLGYTLGPAPLFRAAVRATPFETPIAFEAELDWAAVRYNVALEGLEVPMRPAGHFFDLRGRAAWDVALGAVGISPKLGLGYRALAVQVTEQIEDALVIGSHWVAPEAGLALSLQLSDAASIELGAVARAILGYSEKPVSSGSNGSGFGLTAGASAKYWVSDAFALGAGLDYDYASIATEGLGDRPTFRGDPVLENASVLHSELRLTFGVTFAR